jgi:hypothetical protein
MRPLPGNPCLLLASSDRQCGDRGFENVVSLALASPVVWPSAVSGRDEKWFLVLTAVARATAAPAAAASGGGRGGEGRGRGRGDGSRGRGGRGGEFRAPRREEAGGDVANTGDAPRREYGDRPRRGGRGPGGPPPQLANRNRRQYDRHDGTGRG